VLEDGEYDVIVVDGEGDDGGMRLEVAVLAGAHKGEVVSIRAEGLGLDPLETLGLPGTLTVADGRPSVVLDQ
jgi:hypothetical protein